MGKDTTRYTQYARIAIQLYMMSGRNSQACSMAKDVAEKLEEDYNYEEAVVFYEEAAKMYETDG